MEIDSPAALKKMEETLPIEFYLAGVPRNYFGLSPLGKSQNPIMTVLNLTSGSRTLPPEIVFCLLRPKDGHQGGLQSSGGCSIGGGGGCSGWENLPKINLLLALTEMPLPNA